MEYIGRYRIIGELGRGAMGVVYHAIDPAIGRAVAIKTILLGELTNKEERNRLRDRLLREARSAGRLSHPGIVIIYDVQEQDQLAYIAMELVNGPSLEKLLSLAQPVPQERMLDILRQTAAALDYAHSKGIVHRDIKPANILIHENRVVKITDFGIAKISAAEQYTQAGTILGTPNYMSPEQVQGKPIDGRADQFSLCVIAYEMLTGEKPFTAEHLTTVVYRIVYEQPPSPHKLNPSLGSRIDSVIIKGLAKKPEDRYGSCAEFVTELEEACAATKGWRTLARGGGLDLPTLADEIHTEELTTAETRLPPVRVAERVAVRRRKRRIRWYLIAALLAMAGIGIYSWGTVDPSRWFSVFSSSEAPGQQQTAPKQGTPAPEPQLPREPAATEQGGRKQESPAPNESETSEQNSETPSTGEPKVEAEHTPRPLKAAGQSRPPAKHQPVSVASTPPGAKAVFDGDSAGSSCITPCTVTLKPGRHSVSLQLDGYQMEHREITVSDTPADLSLVTLRKLSGTVMLSSDPPGAKIYVDGRIYPNTTPAQLNLPVGSHTIAVEKNGSKKSEQIEIRDGDLKPLKIPIAP